MLLFPPALAYSRSRPSVSLFQKVFPTWESRARLTCALSLLLSAMDLTLKSDSGDQKEADCRKSLTREAHRDTWTVLCSAHCCVALSNSHLEQSSLYIQFTASHKLRINRHEHTHERWIWNVWRLLKKCDFGVQWKKARDAPVTMTERKASPDLYEGALMQHLECFE